MGIGISAEQHVYGPVLGEGGVQFPEISVV